MRLARFLQAQKKHPVVSEMLDHARCMPSMEVFEMVLFCEKISMSPYRGSIALVPLLYAMGSLNVESMTPSLPCWSMMAVPSV